MKQLGLCRGFSLFPKDHAISITGTAKNGSNLRLQDIVSLLEVQAKRLISRIFIIVDALDECPEKLHYEFLTKLWLTVPKANVLISSRLADPTIDQSDNL